MKNRNLRAPLAVLPLAILALSSHAQTSATSTATELPETVVTATRSHQLLRAVMNQTTVISRADIERVARGAFAR